MIVYFLDDSKAHAARQSPLRREQEAKHVISIQIGYEYNHIAGCYRLLAHTAITQQQ